MALHTYSVPATSGGDDNIFDVVERKKQRTIWDEYINAEAGDIFLMAKIAILSTIKVVLVSKE